ncbi:hypothetical protein [Nonomuraea sp. NPDC052265]
MSGLTVSPDGWRKSSLGAAAGECAAFARSAPGEWRAYVGGVRYAEFEV